MTMSVGEAIAAGRHRTSNGVQRRCFQNQGITQIIQTLRMRQLAIEHRAEFE